MNPTKLIGFSIATLAAGWLCAQTPSEPLIEPVTPPSTETPPNTPASPEAPAQPPADQPPAQPPTLPPTLPPAVPGTPEKIPATITPVPATPANPLETQNKDIKKSEEGFILKDASLNEIFQFLAKSAGRQYFHNTKIAGPEYVVTGHLNDGNPLPQMEELAFMYGLTLHTKGNTIYALTQAQLNQLPSTEFHYQLRYLRPTDIEQIKELIKPMLSPATGIVNFEPKTNTIIIIDSAHRIEQARTMLHGIDKVKGQIIVETKILRVNSNAGERTGVNWATSLGKDGTTFTVTRDLSSIFGLQSPTTTAGAAAGETPATSTGGTNLVLSPLQLTGVLRLLADANLASQISNPTLITEDNEQATISVIDRVPIITTTTTQGSGASANPTVTEQVRYKIDISDKGIDTDPDKHREIGISMVVTPTLLPDGTVRMKLRPRSAQIVEYFTSLSGNKYPRVTESMVESLARVPDGYSLVVGGFYGETTSKGKTKVPILGDIPIVNFFFKSKEAVNEKTSLVFIVTPKSYDPTSHKATRAASKRIRTATSMNYDHDWVDEENPGPAHEPNLRRSLRGLQPTEAPYYPRATEVIEGRPCAPVPSRPEKNGN